MTLDSKHSKDVYQGNGSTTAFPFAFKVWDTSQIAVTVTDAAGASTDVTSNCTVTLTSSGGSVTYPKTGTPLPSGAKLAITRNMPFTQGINLTTASRFDPQVLEDGLDQATAERQQILEQMARAVILPPTSNESPEDVVKSIYASRDAAEASVQAAANSASTAAQTVETAAADATAQANAAHDSALAAAQSAATAAAASEGMAPRMDAVESKIIQQDTRLDAVEVKNTQQDTAINGKADVTALDSKANTNLTNVTNNAIGLYFYARDQKPSGTSGGSASANTWHTRDINTVIINSIGANLSGNQITLQAGTYYIHAVTPVFGVMGSRCALVNVTSGVWEIGRTYCGTGQYAPHNVYASVEAKIVITVPSKFELRTWAEVLSEWGLGNRSNLAVQPEIYSEIRIWKM